MKIPLTITKNRKEYIFVQKYPNFLLYEDLKTKVKECFNFQEIYMDSKNELNIQF